MRKPLIAFVTNLEGHKQSLNPGNCPHGSALAARVNRAAKPDHNSVSTRAQDFCSLSPVRQRGSEAEGEPPAREAEAEAEAE
jgi:hypothetical protein